jgi:hypothetical protein
MFTLKRICAAVSCTCFFVIASVAANLTTAEDISAAKETSLAAPRVKFINNLRDHEMNRPYQDSAEPPSPRLAAMMNPTGSKRPNLGDVRVPLHERLEELA